MASHFPLIQSARFWPLCIAGTAMMVPFTHGGISLAQQSGAQSSLDVRSPEGTRELGNALQRLARNSRDLNALIDAGNAALTLGDPTAAIGFFARAEEIDPRNGRIKAGLGKAVLGTENPYEALRLFDEASALGIPASSFAADRGLAYDLVGKQELAQQDYQIAMRRENSDELTRRYALSLGISGRKDEAEAVLTPLLREQDVAAWRMRAFILAINDDMDGAIAISDATMRPRGARAIRPFLRYFPKLTPSQQAAAAHFGHFPQEANIGRDNPRNAEFADRSSSGSSRRIFRGSRADAGLIPVGEPLGAQSGDGKPERVVDRSPRRRPGNSSETAPSSPAPAPAPVETVVTQQTEQVAVAEAIQDLESGAQPANTDSGSETARPPAGPESTESAALEVEQAAANPPESLLAQTGSPSGEAAQNIASAAPDSTIAAAETQPVAPQSTVPMPGFESLGDPATSSFDLANTGSAAAEGGDAAQPPKEEPADFASLMADLSVPKEELARDQGAVDITAITPAKPKPKPAPEPAEPKHPSRHWVQVAIGADAAALSREWRRLSRKAPDAFAGKKGWYTPLNQTNRVLAGPFGSRREAQAFVNTLAESEFSAFTFTSDEGQVITPLK
ncbi:SPOR domain-containing protein [Alterisphingorhabdus coralli]|uniref:SPOR domain-containing protein n=1 Tax=Alterisphingorhabdus coralli TaxID=3071408 RepID=A0AA97I0X9_9SPHN|nr:SPOR domain-containing protein [Parasphingorhabdus sp. SCSIO 66989]WOE76159.1 SPOR domain-containing protein [Parasphingorhabdus sp. SCSIO 66989]